MGRIDLGSTKNVRAVQLNFYDHKAVQYNRAMDIYHQYRIFASEDGKEWTLVIDKSDSDKDCPHDYIELNEPLRARYLKYENVHMPTGMSPCPASASSGTVTAMSRKP